MIPTRNQFIIAWPNDAHSFCLTAIKALKHMSFMCSYDWYHISESVFILAWHCSPQLSILTESSWAAIVLHVAPTLPLSGTVHDIATKSPHASSAALLFFSFLSYSRRIWCRHLNHLSWQRGIITPCGSQRQGKGDSSTLAAAPAHNVDGRLFKQGCEIKTVGTSDESGNGQAGAGLTVVVILL